MKLTELIVKRPVSAIVVIVGIILFGIGSVIGMPQELMPEMSMPALVVSTVYPGAGPEDVEKLVSQRVEGVVGSLSGIEHIISYSVENASIVVLRYSYGLDMKRAYSDVKARIDQIENDLPDSCQKPVVIEMDINAGDTMTLSIASKSGENLLNFIEDEIVPEFQKLSEVSDVNVYGGLEEYIRVELIEDKLQQYGVSMNTVINSLSTADFSIPSGSADYGSQSLAVRSSVEYETARALENIPIPLGSGNIIRLADVAQIYETTKDASGVSRYNGEESISLGIQKRQSSSAVTVSRQVKQALERLNAENDNFNIIIVDDTSDEIQSSIKSVAQSLLLAIVLSMIVLFIFLGDFKGSLIVGSSMPVSLLVAFILMSQMGFTMNIITMSAMVLGVGMMVDNSIVVLDSCYKSYSEDRTFMQAALAGTKFVLGSIVGSTITTVVVFFPLATIKGMSGQMFGPLGFTIIFALTASLFSAMTLVPLFFTKFQPKEKGDIPAARMLKKVEYAYGNLLRKLLDKKKTVFFVSLALIVVSLFMGTKLNMELIPASDQGIISISVDARPGLQLEKIDEIATKIEKMVAQHPDVEDYTVRAGSGGSGMMSFMGGGGSASITAYLSDDRQMETNDVIEQFRRETKDYIGCTVTISSESMTTSMSTDDILVELNGNDLDELRGFVSEVESVMKQNPDVVTVSSSFSSPAPQAEIVVDPMKAAAAGFTPMQVASNVNLALSGKEASTMRRGTQDYSIMVEYPQGKYTTVNDLSNLMMTSPSGATVPLMDIASIEFTDTPQTIQRWDNQYQVTVTGTPTYDARFTAKADVMEKINALQFPDGVSFARGIEAEYMNQEFVSLGVAILVAIWLVFMVMAIQFESVKHSLMVMICIPFSMIGSFALMFITGTTISMVSLLGFLILVGTVVNNGILFVDSANQYRQSMDVKTALVYTGRNRLRPILMTTLTTILSMLPMVFATGSASTMNGLGMVVIGGLTVSTVLTLILLPTFYLMIDGNEEKKQKREEKKRQKLEEKRQKLEAKRKDGAPHTEQQDSH